MPLQIAPPAGHRIGLPFLLRGRSDAVLDTRSQIRRAAEKGDVCCCVVCHAQQALLPLPGLQCHLAEMETVTIKELPSFPAAKAILKNWFWNLKNDKIRE